MDFTIKRADLLSAIEKCSVAVPGDHQNRAFNAMRVEGKGKKRARFVGVGERASVDTLSEAEVKTPGSFHVHPKRLHDIATVMPEGGVRFSMTGSRVTVKSAVSSRKASFENLVADIFQIDDPGKEAPWVEVDAKVLSHALSIVRPMSVWEDRSDPIVSLLVPTERGLDVFGCNGKLIGIVETPLRVTGTAPIQVPEQAVAVLTQMIETDEVVRIFADERRVYLENCDTLVSAALPASYPFLATHTQYMQYVRGKDGNERTGGPTFDAALLVSGVKSVLALGGFASADERKKGMVTRLSLGRDVVRTELLLGVADAKDEFAVVAEDSEIAVLIDSGYLLKILAPFSGTPVVKSYLTHDDLMLIIQSQGLTCGAITKVSQ